MQGVEGWRRGFSQYVPAAEQQLTAVPWGSAAAASSGAYSNGQPALEVGGFYSHQPPAGALGGAAARRGAAPIHPRVRRGSLLHSSGAESGGRFSR